jgi:hypothetical protein
MAEDFAMRCHTSATMDIKTVQGRVKHEGFSFLTITLPDFGKDFQKSLDQGLVDPTSFHGFRRKGGLPLFLGGFLDRVFSRSTGVLFDEPDIDSILGIRQLTLMFSKINLPCSNARYVDAMNGYIDCEQEVRRNDLYLHHSYMAKFESMSSRVFASVFSKIDSDIYYGNVLPKHGPGSTADRLMGNRKFKLKTWTDRLEEIFPAGEFLFPSWSHYLDHIDSVRFLEPGAEMPVKVISVPKTMKTPRIIAMEPSYVQFAQQGVLELILKHLKSDVFLDAVLGFDDQLPNQQMACEGSLLGNLATLDLSEASDRVSNQHVRALVKNHKYLKLAVDATRSRKADVPGHGVVRLAKYASMGSALCFPFEAMTFLVIVLCGIEEQLNTPLTNKHLHDLVGKVRIYGDDIIIPVDYVEVVNHWLSVFGHKVGEHKSFWNGKFRESCGKEYYNGHDVSIVKVRQVFPSSRQDATGVISLVSFRNQCYFAGYWRVTKWLDEQVKKVLPFFPNVEPTSPVLGRHSFLGYLPEKIGADRHDPLVRGYVISPRLPRNSLDGHGALLKFFLKRGGLPSADGRHLERSGRPLAVDIKLRWAPPY